MYTGVIDVSHWEYDSLRGNLTPALQQAREGGGIGVVIAKATQGKDYVDPSFRAWANASKAATMLFGAYHFGSNTEPGDQQADWFLEHLRLAGVDVATTLLCLDFERHKENGKDRTMPLCEARTFLHRVHARTGQQPLLYGDSSFLGQIKDPRDVLGEFPLWVAAYGPTVPKIPRAWTGAGRHGYTLFQYTDGPQGPSDRDTWPRETPGFHGVNLDRSAFNGDEAQLRARWPQL